MPRAGHHQQPIKWTKVPAPVTLVGDTSWTDYTVSTKALLQQPGTVSLLGPGDRELNSTNHPAKPVDRVLPRRIRHRHLDAAADRDHGTILTLAQGTVPALGTGSWHTLALRFNGDTITALIDQTPVGTVADTTFAAGQTGLMLGSYIGAQFDDYSSPQLNGGCHQSKTSCAVSGPSSSSSKITRRSCR